jgi:hypothetical protein
MNIKKNKYLLHGHFNDKIIKTIDKTRNYLFKKYNDYKYEGRFTYGFPHITIIYGPVIYSNKEIIINKNTINKFYPGFLDKFKELPTDIKFIEITAFLSLDKISIVAEFESKQLNKMKKYLIETIPEIKKYYEEFDKTNNISDKELKKLYPNIFIKNKSYKTYKRWIHATLIVIKPNLSEDIIIKIMKDANKYIGDKFNGTLSFSEIGINLSNIFNKILY